MEDSQVGTAYGIMMKEPWLLARALFVIDPAGIIRYTQLVAASYDPVAIDAFGAGLLGRDGRKVGHIRRTNGRPGIAEPLTIADRL